MLGVCMYGVASSGLMVGSELGTQGQAVVLVESKPHGEQTNAEPEAKSYS